MTDFLASLAVAIGESLALSLVVKATVVAAAGLVIARAMRNVRASRKYLVLAWTFVVLGAMPLAVLLLGPLAVVVREVESVSAKPAAASALSLNGVRDLVPNAAGGPAVPVATSRRDWKSAGALAAAGWAIGVLMCLLPMARTLRRLRLLRRTARVWKENEVATILRHDDVSVPMTFGVRRPVVLLPNDLSAWSDADVERALVHELEHVRRRDWPVHLFARFICALYWFHPVVWRAGRQLYLQADQACDDAVVRRGDGDAFADQLVALAGRLLARQPAEVPSMGGGDLSTRVMAIVNPRRGRGRAGVACRLIAGVVAIACGAAIAPLKAVEMNRQLRLGAQVPATDSTQAPLREQAGGAKFEVASVKPAPDSTRTRALYRPEPTRFSGDFSVIDAVAFSYRLEESRIVDAPPWARNERYQINATTPPRKPGDIQAMMRHLLEERFALKVHREQRPLAVYVLRLAGADGRFGPRLQRVQRDCTRSASNSSTCSASSGVGNYRSSGERWEIFVASLDTGITGRPVVDKTGLSGQFDITLDWTPDVDRAPGDVRNAPSGGDVEAPPALFTALREQLGLKLDSDTAAMDVLVIDSVRRPTPD